MARSKARKLADILSGGTALEDGVISASEVVGLGTAATSAATDFVAVAGDSMTGNLNFGDNDRAIFGASSNLQIYYDGINSRIYDIGSGDLRIIGSNLRLLDANGENFLYAVQDAAVTLYYDNASKISTTSTGVDVTGTVAATAFTGDGSALTGVGASTTFGDVGTYIWGRPANLTDYAAGDTASGLYATSNKHPDTPPYYTAYVSGGWDSAITVETAVSGTWRCMAGTDKYNSNYAPSSLWVRIS